MLKLLSWNFDVFSRGRERYAAQMFYLKQLVGGSSSFPYTLGTAYSNAFGDWTHFEGTGKEDNSAVSIFRLSADRSDHAKLQAARNGVKRLKSVPS